MVDKTNERAISKFGLLAIPGALVSALPILACALCWPPYAALISSLGLGFLGSSTYLLPLTAALLAVAVIGLGLQTRKNGYGPFALGLVAVGAIVPGKFRVGSDAMTYGGVMLLVAASVWSVLPRRSGDSVACSECAPARERSPQQA